MEKAVKKKTLIGTVTSNKMDKTVVVIVERRVKHPIYKKYVQRRSKFKAHDSGNKCSEGDRVSIIESRPLSKQKRWKVVQIIEKVKKTSLEPAVEARGEI